MKNFDDSKTVENNGKLEQNFKDERKDWNAKIGDLLNNLRRTDKLSETQAYGLSYRQMLVEKMTQYRILLHKKMSVYDKARVDRAKLYMTEGDYKLTGAERSDFVTADLGAVKFQMQLLEDQIDWIGETLQTLSSLQFAIKNKIEIIKEEIL